MAATYTDNGTNTPNGSHLEFSYSFPVLKTEDVKVSLNGVTQATTKYAVDNTSNPTKITFNNTNVDSTVQESTGAPKTGVLVRVYRETTVGKTDGNEDPKAVFAAGSSIRAADLNNNQEQALFGIHELQQQKFDSDSGADIKTAYEAESNTNAYTDAEKSKLSGIATGAEVNVQSDWSASSGDEQILNKPDLSVYSTTSHNHDSSYSATSHNHDSSYADLSGATFTGNCDFSAGVDVTGNITVTGTVDGVDIAALNTTVGTKFPFAGGTLDGNVRFNGSNVSNYLFWNKSADSLTAVNGTITTTTLDVTGNITVGGTVDGIDIATDVAANTAKVTNATHTGEVTGSTALTIADDVVDEANLKISNAGSDGQYLQKQSGNTGGLTWATVSGSSAGGANTIHLNDDVELTFGDANTPDLKIWHESDGYGMIVNKTGDLYIQGNDGYGTAQTAIEIVENGGVRLKYQGANDPSLETTSTGAKVTGKLGVGVDPTYQADIKITSTDAYSASAFDNGQNQLRINNAGASGVAGILFTAEPSSGSAGHASIRTIAPSNGSADLIFSTRNSSTFSEKLRIAADGTTTIAGNVTTGELLTVSGAEPRLVFTDTDNTPDFTIWGKDGDFQITNTSLGGDVTQFSIDGATGNATFTGTVTAPSVASSANGMRKMTTSTSAPSGGSDGDVWFKYTA